jgi:hypothetical protein
MSNKNPQNRPYVTRRTFALCAICALAVISMTWYSHSLTPAAAQAKKAPPQPGVRGSGPGGIDSSLLLSPQKWVGRKFVVLDKPNIFRKFGYELYLTKDLSTSVKRIDTTLETGLHHLRYDKCRGSVLTVTAMEPVAGEWMVSFSRDQSPTPLYAKTHKGAIEGLAFSEDLDKAAKMWVGKVVYAKRRFINTYDSAAGTFGTIKVNIQERCAVNAVRWGTTPLPPKPLWLCVSTEKKEAGIISISQSWVNVMTDRIAAQAPWDAEVFEKSPMEIFSWDSTTWKAINNHDIVSGMNKEQVRVSWGPPHRVLKDTVKLHCAEQWIYGSQYLCFDHDTVNSVGAR